jgi:hypothetical protein
MRRLLIALAAAACLLTTGLAAEQNVQNPTGVSFTASADHALVDRYVLGVFTSATETIPVREVDLGKPTPDTNQVCSVSINLQPLPFGANYLGRVRAVASTAMSDWSEASNPFDRVPGKPSTPVIKK